MAETRLPKKIEPELNLKLNAKKCEYTKWKDIKLKFVAKLLKI